MLLISACYTNTSDSYPLKKYQQVLVIGAGIICQVVMAAISFLLWYISDSASEVHTTAYLLMATGLVTLAINLNPLSGGLAVLMAIIWLPRSPGFIICVADYSYFICNY